MTELKEVPQIHKTSLVDIPGRLRELAQRIERGEYQVVHSCAIVLWHDVEDESDRTTISTLGYGLLSDHANITTVLLAGANDSAARLKG